MSADNAAGHRERLRRPPRPSPRGCPVRAWPGSTAEHQVRVHSLASYRHGVGYPSLTWEFGFSCHPLSRLVSFVRSDRVWLSGLTAALVERD